MENGTPDEPLYLSAARRLKREDEDIEAFLARNAEATSDSRFPGPGCLHPDELFEYRRTGSLAEDRKQHLETCAACSAMVEATKPSPERVRAFIEAVPLVRADSLPEGALRPARSGFSVPAFSVAFAGLAAFVGMITFWHPALEIAGAPKPPIAPAERVIMTAELATPARENPLFVRTAPLTVTASAKDVATTMAATAAKLVAVDTGSSPDACQQPDAIYYAGLLSDYVKYWKGLKDGEAKDDIVTWSEKYSKMRPPSAGAAESNHATCQPDAPTLKATFAYYVSLKDYKLDSLELPSKVISLNAPNHPRVNITAKAEPSVGSILYQPPPRSAR